MTARFAPGNFDRQFADGLLGQGRQRTRRSYRRGDDTLVARPLGHRRVCRAGGVLVDVFIDASYDPREHRDADHTHGS
jgi:hypothetical protein